MIDFLRRNIVVRLIFMWLVLSAAPVFGEGSVSFNSGNGARTFMAGLGRIMADFESFKDSAVFSNPNAGLFRFRIQIDLCLCEIR